MHQGGDSEISYIIYIRYRNGRLTDALVLRHVCLLVALLLLVHYGEAFYTCGVEVLFLSLHSPKGEEVG